MKLLHVLSESETDAFFYERIAERITESCFVRTDVRLRRGSGHHQVMASVKLLLGLFPKEVPREDCAVLLSVDNDRCPDHPGAGPYGKPLTSAEQRRRSRWKDIQEAMHARWGENRTAWPVDVAVAIPVEMIESWILLLLDPARGSLPFHSRQDSVTAIAYHHPQKPGPQLKDLAEAAARQRDLGKQELLTLAAEGDLAAVEAVSPSFRMFAEDLRSWS